LQSNAVVANFIAFGHSRFGIDPPPALIDDSVRASIAQNFTQQLDHFNSSNTAKWQQVFVDHYFN
jgi:hypothetical protein